MADQALRLKASVSDQATVPLKKIQGELKKLGDNPATKQLAQNLEGLKGGLVRLGSVADEGVSSLAAFSMGALGLVGVLGTMANAVKGVSEQGKNLTNFTRQTGMSAQTLQEFQVGLQKFGVSADQAASGIETLHQKAFLLRRGLNASEFMFDPSFAAKLKSAKDANEELAVSFEELQKYTDPNQRQYVSLKLFGDSSFAAVHSLAELKQAIEAARNSGAILTPDQIAAGDKFADSMQRVQNALLGIRNNTGTVIADSLMKPMEDLGTYLNAHSKEIADGIGSIATAIGSLKSAGDSLADSLNGINDYVSGAAKAVHDSVFGKVVDGAKADYQKRMGHDLGNTSVPVPAGFVWNHPSSGPYIENPKTPYGSLTRDNTAHGDALSDQGAKFGEGVSKALTKPMGGAEQFGKQSAKSFWQWLSDALVSPAKADTLAGVAAGNLAAVGGTYNGGLRMHGVSGGGGRRRTRGAAAGQPGVAYSPSGSMPFNSAEWDAYREGVTDIEGKAYNHMGGASGRFAGRYQMGGSEITQTARELGVPRPTNAQFLANPGMQERFFERYTQDHYNYLMRNPKFAHMSHEQQLQILGYAHNQGAGGANGYLNTGRAGADAWGTSGTAYFGPIHKRYQRSLTDAVRTGQPAHPHTVTPATATGTVNVHITGDRKDKVSVNGDGLFKKVQVSRRFFNTQKEVA